MAGFFEVLLFLMLFFVYFVPTIVAYSRKHRNTLAIFILNLFAGYTLFGWVAAMIWAVYKPEESHGIRKNKKK